MNYKMFSIVLVIYSFVFMPSFCAESTNPNNIFKNTKIDLTKSPYKETLEIFSYLSKTIGQRISEEDKVDYLKSKYQVLDATKCLSILTVDPQTYANKIFSERYLISETRLALRSFARNFEDIFESLPDKTYFDLCEILAKGDDFQQSLIHTILWNVFDKASEKKQKEYVDKLISMMPFSNEDTNRMMIALVNIQIDGKQAMDFVCSILRTKELNQKQKEFFEKMLYKMENYDPNKPSIKIIQ